MDDEEKFDEDKEFELGEDTEDIDEVAEEGFDSDDEDPEDRYH